MKIGEISVAERRTVPTYQSTQASVGGLIDLLSSEKVEARSTSGQPTFVIPGFLLALGADSSHDCE